MVEEKRSRNKLLKVNTGFYLAKISSQPNVSIAKNLKQLYSTNLRLSYVMLVISPLNAAWVIRALVG